MGGFHGLGAVWDPKMTHFGPQNSPFWTHLGPKIDPFWTPFGVHIQGLATSGASTKDGAARQGLKAPPRGHVPARPSRDGRGGDPRMRVQYSASNGSQMGPISDPRPQIWRSGSPDLRSQIPDLTCLGTPNWVSEGLYPGLSSMQHPCIARR